MARSSSVILRFPVLALAAADLVLLALRLRPWNALQTLPNEGTAAIDPLISLGAYLGLMLWVSAIRNPFIRQALAAGSLCGIAGGTLLVFHLLLPPRPDTAALAVHIGLFVGAGILWSAAGLLGARAADHFAIGIVSGAWSAMVSALMACVPLLLRLSAVASVQPGFNWWQYQDVPEAIPVMQALVHALNVITGFLLFCPLIGATLGLVCGLGHEGKSS